MTDEVFEVQFDQHDSFCNSQFLLARGDRNKLAKSQEAFMTYYEQPMKLRWDRPHTDAFVQTLKLRASLIREEAEETIDAIEHILEKIESRWVEMAELVELIEDGSFSQSMHVSSVVTALRKAKKLSKLAALWEG